MRTLGLLCGTLVAGLGWHLHGVVLGEACSLRNEFPDALGQTTFLLATATGGAVTAPVDSLEYPELRQVPAQLMKVDDVAGYMSDRVERAMQSMDGIVVFVRYGYGPDCTTALVRDGGFDSVGTSGVYGAVPRPERDWIGGRPTFDLYAYSHTPQPQAYVRRAWEPDSAPLMSAPELMAMYRALWMESAPIDRRVVRSRIERWARSNPLLARKYPAGDIAQRMLSASMTAWIRAHEVPLGGTFRLSFSAAGIDSFSTYGRTSRHMHVWRQDLIRHRATGIPIDLRPLEYAAQVGVASSLSRLEAGEVRDACSLDIIVDRWPIVLDADSSWTGRTSVVEMLNCSSSRSVRESVSELERRAGMTPVVFRRASDGTVTFEARVERQGLPLARLYGERISSRTDGW